MSTFSKIRKSLPLPSLTSLKQLLPDQIRFPSRSFQFFDNLDAPRATDMAREVGDGTSADVLMTPIRWKQRAMVEAPMVVRDAAGDPIADSALTELLANPNPEYSFAVLMAGTTLSMDLDGNAYWLIARNEDGVPVELWYAPHPNIEPRWPQNRNDVFISHYEYKVGGQVAKLEPEDVIHFREGIDLSNTRKGLSPLKGLLREIWTDNEAAIFTASLLRNGGIPGVVVSPADKDVTLDLDQAKAIEARIDTKFARAGRGRTLVLTAPVTVEQFGFSPKDLDLSPLRDVSEERVTAAMGIPAAVVGFGAGLQATKVGATMEALVRLAWTNGVIPMQRVIAGEVTRTLVPAFDGVAAATFDNSDVEALRENEDTKAMRAERLYRGGVWTRAEARTATGQESTPADDVYSVPMTTTLLPQGQAAPVLGNGNNNGNGDGKRLVAAAKQITGAGYLLTANGLLLLKEHSHDPTEERIIAASPSAPPTAVASRMAGRLDRIRARAPGILAPIVAAVFEDLGAVALAAAAEQINELDIQQAADGRPVATKQNELLPEDIALLARIIGAVDTVTAQADLAVAFERGYLQIAEQVSGAIGDTFGFAFELNDVAQGNVMRAGGLNAGLIDLDQQTRDAIFDGLASGRAEGLNGDALARHISEFVEAGPWRDARTRADIIARTEGANAANVSTLEAARTMPETSHVQIFDNRAGFGDAACVAADGVVVTIEEADAMGLAHPNCSRSFVPINALLMDEMFGTQLAGPARPIDGAAG